MFFDFHVFCGVNERPDSAVRECCKKKKSINVLEMKIANNLRFENLLN